MPDDAPVPTIQEKLEFVAYQINTRYGKHPEADLIREAIAYINLLEAPSTKLVVTPKVKP